MKRYIKSSDSINTPKIISVTPIYTGGGIYIYWGAFSDGTYFIADDDYDLTIVDSDPTLSYVEDEDIFEADYSEWQEKHLVRYIDDNKTQNFFNEMFDWILQNEPSTPLCNYSLGDIETRRHQNNNETGGPGDRNKWLGEN